ncbi:MAG: T9SS type A sorting domain-containing protein [Saprospiraceae bacterium]|nr:T9SS type A sorting domain-containing protein [Saprospiraceae bacterium]
MKTDLEGTPLVIKTIRNPAKSYQTWHPEFSALPEGGFVVAGYSLDSISKAILIRYDSDGDTLFTRFFSNLFPPPNDFIWPRAFVVRPDGGYLFACEIQALPNGGYQDIDIWIVKTDSLGEVTWQRRLGNNRWERPYSLLVDQEGNIIVGGSKRNTNLTTSNYTFQNYIIKLNPAGNTLWEYLSPASLGLRYGAADMVLLSDGSLVVASGVGYEQQRTSFNDVYFDKYIFKLNNLHEIEWELTFKETALTGTAFLTNIIAVSDGSGFVAAGTHSQNFPAQNAFSLRGWIGKVSPDGDSLWTRQYVGIDQLNNRQAIYDLKETSDGGFILCGESRNPSPAPGEIVQQAWLLKLDQYGCLVPGCHITTSTEESEPERLRLALYPNPAAEYLNFYLRAPAGVGSEVSFRIFDAGGRLLREFPHASPDATYVIEVWDWPAGMYVLQCVSGGRVLAAEKFIKQ